MTTATKPPEQKELKGMPKPKGAALIVQKEWFPTKAQLRQKEDQLKDITSRILTGMEGEKKQVMKVEDPITHEMKKFEVDEGEVKLRVTTIKDNVGKTK